MSIVDLAVREKEKKTLDDRLNKCRYALAQAKGVQYKPWYPSFFWWAGAAKDDLLDPLPAPPSAATGGSRRNRKTRKSRQVRRTRTKSLRSK